MPYLCLKCYRELFLFQNLFDNQLYNELSETKSSKDKKLIPLDELPDNNNCYMTTEANTKTIKIFFSAYSYT